MNLNSRYYFRMLLSSFSLVTDMTPIKPVYLTRSNLNKNIL